MKKNAVHWLLLTGWLLIAQPLHAQLQDDQEVRQFIAEMVAKHGFAESQLVSVFSEAKVSNTILEAISRPAEAKPWYQYRPIFLQNERIRLGREFIKQNHDELLEAEQRYGVPPEIIAAIIGVETRYGKNTGSYKVIDSLVTLGFKYPKRSEFFRSELEQFLLLAREQGIDPRSVKGSYAGAMGIPQFISSSYRNFAVDFDNDGSIDIWANPADAIGSVANYFSEHGWVNGEQIVVRAKVSGDRYQPLIDGKLELDRTVSDLAAYGVTAGGNLKADSKARLFRYELEDGEEFWLGLNNFYVITRYNRSPLYAMAVVQLAEQIAEYRNEVVRIDE